QITPAVRTAIATTENAVLIFDWDRLQVVREILPMRYLDALPDKVPLLDSHWIDSIDRIKGSAINWHISGGQLRAGIVLASHETKIESGIKRGDIASVSIGYITDPAFTVEIPKGKTVKIDGIPYSNDYSDGIPLLIRTWWKVRELSLVAIGADAAAKILHTQTK